jgi:hypothetical protein
MACMSLSGHSPNDASLLDWTGWTLASAGPPWDGQRCKVRIRDSQGLSWTGIVEVEATYSDSHGGFINEQGERFINGRPILGWKAIHRRR